MLQAYETVFAFVQSLTPTWYKHQQRNFAQLLTALIERPRLALTELVRGLPEPAQPLHGKIKRVCRFLDNPRLDELALTVRWLKLTYHFGADVPGQSETFPLLPVLLDTVYFEPFAVLLATVPCGSRGLPVALTTYHRTTLDACFPPEATWPGADLGAQPLPRRGHRRPPAASVVTTFLSQNLIEHQLIALLWHLLSPALRAVLVADRGFARAALFVWLRAAHRDFVIRVDAQTHIYLDPAQPSQAISATLALTPGERRWCPQVCYGQQDRVPVNLLGVWDDGQAEPWYLATSLDRADWTETAYRWRMRTECTHRDAKTGVLLREGGDDHALRNVHHLHRLLLVVAAAEWLSALAGLQAAHDLATPQPVSVTEPSAPRLLPPAAVTPSSVPSLPVPPPLGASAAPPLPLPDPASTLPDCPDQRANGPCAPTSGPAMAVRQDAEAVPTPAAPASDFAAFGLRVRSAASATPTVPDDGGPALPPPVLPHRGPTPKLPSWMKRFAARGQLSYVRLGLEVLRAADLGWVLRRMVDWLVRFLWPWRPFWRPWQHRYRRLHGWPGFG